MTNYDDLEAEREGIEHKIRALNHELESLEQRRGEKPIASIERRRDDDGTRGIEQCKCLAS